MKLFELIGLNEDASVASTTAGSIAPVAAPLGAVQRRIQPDSFFTGVETTDLTPNTPKEYKAYKSSKRSKI
jgi:hypothetical protein